MKNISGVAILAACMLPAAAFAQDTTRTTRDSAAARSGSSSAVRFDASQNVTVTGATIVRIDSVSSSAGASGSSMGVRAPGSTGMAGTSGGMGSTGSATTGSTGSMGSTGSGAGSAGTAGTTGTGSATGSATGGMTGSATAGSMGSAGSASVGTRGSMAKDGQAYGATGGKSINAIVTSGSDTMHVMLAPAEYLTAQQLTLKAGDQVNLKGVKMQMGAVTHLVATEITKDGKTVQIRDAATGTPSWTAGATLKSDSSSMNRTMPRTDSTGSMNRARGDSTGTTGTRRDSTATVRPTAGTRDSTTSPVRKP